MVVQATVLGSERIGQSREWKVLTTAGEVLVNIQQVPDLFDNRKVLVSTTTGKIVATLRKAKSNG